MVDELRAQLKNPKDLAKSIEALQDENVKMRKEVEQLNKTLVQYAISELTTGITIENNLAVLFKEVALDASGMKDALFKLGQNRDNFVAVLASKKNNKPIVSCYVSKALAEQGVVQANTIIKAIGPHIQGGGGGQAFFATAGGKNPAGISKALTAAKEMVLNL